MQNNILGIFNILYQISTDSLRKCSTGYVREDLYLPRDQAFAYLMINGIGNSTDKVHIMFVIKRFI